MKFVQYHSVFIGYRLNIIGKIDYRSKLKRPSSWVKGSGVQYEYCRFKFWSD